MADQDPTQAQKFAARDTQHAAPRAADAPGGLLSQTDDDGPVVVISFTDLNIILAGQVFS